MDRTRSREKLLESRQCETGTVGGLVTDFSWDHLMREQVIDTDPTQWNLLREISRNRAKVEKTLPAAAERMARFEENVRITRDLGGYFLKNTASVTGGRRVSATRKYFGQNLFIKGHVMPGGGPGTVPAYLTPTIFSTLYALGGKAVRACAPTNPHANLLVTIGEIFKDGVPTVPGLQALKAKGRQDLASRGSGEYLNVEFGWKPMISDVLAIMEAALKSDKIWRDFINGSGKAHHRKIHFDPVVTTAMTKAPGAYPWPTGVTQLHSNAGVRHVVTQTHTEYWFSGSFRYHVPGDRDGVDKARRAVAKARHLFGIDFSPDVIWNLLPWSWLIDWAADIGGLMRSLSLFSRDGLVLQYGYLMEHRIETVTTSLIGHRYFDGSTGDSTSVSTRESKRRVRASPFGFGVDEETLTPRQLAILAAIGISRRQQ